MPGVIDLHLHTTASDGLLNPSQLVDMAWRAGIRTFSVTDHDTVRALPDAARLAADWGMRFVPGIEITAVHAGVDVHILGYFVDANDVRFGEFLARQRADRVRRLEAMRIRLEELGKALPPSVLSATTKGAAPGRPLLARALVKAGHVADMRQAFDELIGHGKPAYVARVGPSPVDVIKIIADAGGIASLAHPGLLKHDTLIHDLAAAGLAAIEAFHSDHDEAVTAHYLAMAERLGLAVSGGSDYHGEPVRRQSAFGRVGLPPEHFERLSGLAGRKEL